MIATDDASTAEDVNSQAPTWPHQHTFLSAKGLSTGACGTTWSVELLLADNPRWVLRLARGPAVLAMVLVSVTPLAPPSRAALSEHLRLSVG